MCRPLKALLLIAVMLWQTLAWVMPATVHAQGEQLAHLSVHQQDIDHHHHDDASLHLASDQDSGLHFHADAGIQPLALMAWANDTAFGSVTGARPATQLDEPPSVFLDGLLRPPSPLA